MEQHRLYEGFGLLNGKFFVREFDTLSWNITDEHTDVLKQGPEHYNYNKTWEQVLNTAFKIVGNKRYTLLEHENKTLFVVANEIN